jgi:hypothetical protein
MKLQSELQLAARMPSAHLQMWERQDSNLRMGFCPNWFTASLLCRSDARSPDEEPQ